MKLRNSEGRFGAPAQVFHWGSVALVVVTVALAAYMTDLPLSTEKFQLYNLHKSLGILVLALTLPRLIWRWVSPPPPMPASMQGWEHRAAQASHIGLYLLLFLQPVTGIFHSWAADFPIVIFNSYTLPNLTGPNETLKNVLGFAHHWLGWAFCALFLLHAGAALRHHFLLKDDVLTRMLPWSREGSRVE